MLAQARQIMVQNPQLTKALFQAQIMLGMVPVPAPGGGPPGPLQPPQPAPPQQPSPQYQPPQAQYPPPQQGGQPPPMGHANGGPPLGSYQAQGPPPGPPYAAPPHHQMLQEPHQQQQHQQQMGPPPQYGGQLGYGAPPAGEPRQQQHVLAPQQAPQLNDPRHQMQGPPAMQAQPPVALDQHKGTGT